MGRLDDRVAIVTGGVAALARRLRCAWRPTAHPSSSTTSTMPPLTKPLPLIEQAGGKAIECVANTVDMAQAEALIQATIGCIRKDRHRRQQRRRDPRQDVPRPRRRAV